MAMATSPYAVDRSRLTRRGRGIVPVLEQKQRQRPGNSIKSGPGSANALQLSQLSQLQQNLCDQKELLQETPRVAASDSRSDKCDKDVKDVKDPEAQEEPAAQEAQENREAPVPEAPVNEEIETGEAEAEGCEQSWLGEDFETAGRLPKPTEVSQDGKGTGVARAKSSSKSGTLTRPPIHSPGTKPKRTRSAERPQKFVLAQPSRRIPQRLPSPETRDIASSPMSPYSPPGNTLQSESLSGLFRELGILREDFIAAKLDSERARERIQELEGENMRLKKQLQEAEKSNRKLHQQKHDLEHSSDLWHQRWEDSQQQLEECWKRFDALKVVKEEAQAEQPEQPERRRSETFSSKSSVEAVEPSPLSGACQVELSSPSELPTPRIASLPSEVRDPPAVEITSASSEERAPTSAVTPRSCPAGHVQHIQQIQQVQQVQQVHGFQTPPVTPPMTPPVSGSFPLGAIVSPRTMPANSARSSFPSPQTQQALRVVTVPSGAANMYFSSQLPVQVGSPMADYRRQSVPVPSSEGLAPPFVVFTAGASVPNTVMQSPRIRTVTPL